MRYCLNRRDTDNNRSKVIYMFDEKIANHAIRCTVRDCRHHKGDQNYCSLDSIEVASNVKEPTDESCVDCRSFSCKNKGVNC